MKQKRCKKLLLCFALFAIIALKASRGYFVMDFISICITVLSIAISVGISWGVITQKIRHLETRLNALEKDHDLLVRIDTKLTMFIEQSDKKKK